MNTEVVAGVAGALQDSARAVNDSAVRVAAAGLSFEPRQAGRDYLDRGRRVSEGLERVARMLFGWANSSHDCGTALQPCVAAGVVTEQSSAAELVRLAGVAA
ncbi:hypothetical protein AB0H71_29725 [Nocardia sp. NPDC050697]|uniref:hypothetical protein n=1 Tax=Nocardia sp. NPDC050697 TaxID=3155158 RepID=UPI003407E8C8